MHGEHNREIRCQFLQSCQDAYKRIAIVHIRRPMQS